MGTRNQQGAATTEEEEELQYVVEGEHDSDETANNEADNSGNAEHVDDDDGADDEGNASGNGDADNDDDRNDNADSSASEEITDEEREHIRERRRAERKNRRNNARERDETQRREIEALRRETQELREQLKGVNSRSHAGDIARVDEELKKTESSNAFYREQIRVATEAGNGAAVAEATEKLLDIRVARERLAAIREQLVKQGSARENSAVDPTTARLANDWVRRNSWYNPDPRQFDTDSAILRQLDSNVAQRFRPNTKEYWDELDSMVKKYLPHRAVRGTVGSADEASDRSDAPNTRGKKVVVPSPNNTRSGRPSGQGQKSGAFVLSKERKQAIVDAGMWDDPKERNEMIRQYREYDRVQASKFGNN